jgi:hypothetical protein
MPRQSEEKDLEASIPLIHTNAGGSSSGSVSGAEAEKELELELRPGSPLASTTATQQKKPVLPAAAIIPIWMALSASVILYNNYILNTLEFKYPIFLVTWHLIFSVSLM